MKREFSVSSDGSTAASPPGSDYRPSSPEQAQNKTPSATPTKKARSTPASPCKSVPSPTKAQKSLSSAGSTATSVKGRFAEMIIDAGAQAVSKDAVQAETGLNPRQQHDLTRKDGKGSLRKALMAVAATL